MEATKNFITLNKNVAMYARNQKVYANINGKKICLVPRGYAVAYDASTGMSIDHTDLTTATKFIFGVSKGKSGLQFGMDIKSVDFGQGQYADDFLSMITASGHCGQSPLYDIYFGCIKCNKQYGLAVHVIDESTDRQKARNVNETFPVSVPGGICSCDDCTTPAAISFACYVRDHFKRELADRLKSIPQFPDDRRFVEDLPFDVHLIYGGAGATNRSYCLAVSSPDGCVDCTHALGVKSIKVGDADAVAINYYNDPDNPGYGFAERLPILIEEMNVALGDKGSVTLTQSGGPCCPAVIQMSSCETIILLDNDDEEIPYVTLTVPTELAQVTPCGSCGTQPDAITNVFPGLRFIPKPVDLSAWGAQFNRQQIITRTLEFSFGTGFEPGQAFYYEDEVQQSLPPANMGYNLIEHEYEAERQGAGGSQSEAYNMHVGVHDVLHQHSRILDQDTVWNKFYDVINVTYRKSYGAHTAFGHTRVEPTGICRIALLNNATTLSTSVLQFWNAVNTLRRRPDATLAFGVVPGYSSPCGVEAQAVAQQVNAQATEGAQITAGDNVDA